MTPGESGSVSICAQLWLAGRVAPQNYPLPSLSRKALLSMAPFIES